MIHFLKFKSKTYFIHLFDNRQNNESKLSNTLYVWILKMDQITSMNLQGCYLVMKVGHESNLQGCVWNYKQCANCQRIGCFARDTSCHVRVTLQPSRIVNLLWNCETGWFNIESESWTISLLSVKFVSMADDVFFSLPFAKVEKTFRDNWISDADVLSCRDCLESNLKQKYM